MGARLLAVALAIAVGAHACSWSYLIWMIRGRNSDPLFQFESGGKTGYIDRNGTVVVADVKPYIYDEVSDGLLSLGHGKFLNREGKTLDFGRIESIWSFSEGLAAYREEATNKWGYRDTSGKVAIPAKFEGSPNGYPYSFSEGLAMIEVKGWYGFINKKGDWVIPPQLPLARDFQDGMALVVPEGPCVHFTDGPCAEPQFAPRSARDVAQQACKISYINQKGELLKQRFDRGRPYAEGLAPVRLGNRWGYIDKAGEWAIQPLFEDAEPFSDGRAAVRINERWGYIDRNGAIIVQPIYLSHERYGSGRVPVVKSSGSWQYLDSAGQPAFPGEFKIASHFVHGLAHVELPGRARGTFAYLDPQGREVFRYTR